MWRGLERKPREEERMQIAAETALFRKQNGNSYITVFFFLFIFKGSG